MQLSHARPPVSATIFMRRNLCEHRQRDRRASHKPLQSHLKSVLDSPAREHITIGYKPKSGSHFDILVRDDPST